MMRMIDRRFVSLLAIASLLLRVGVGIVFAPMLANAAEAGRVIASPDGPRTIVICSGNGIKKIVIDAQGNPVEQENVPEHCQICLAMANGTVMLDVAELAPLFVCELLVSDEYAVQALAIGQLFEQTRNRSPPFSL